MKRLFYLLAAAAFTACGSATTLSVMTFNMRYDNPEDGADNWRFRRGRVAEVIASHGVDVFGTQELLAKAAPAVLSGVTAPNENMLVLRCASPVVEPVMMLWKTMWSFWREELWGLQGGTPRIWSM